MSATYTTLREKIAAEKAERADRYAGFAKLWADAHAAGLAAGNAARPTPMIVRNGAVLLNGRPVCDPGASLDKIVDVVPDGACGFAWIVAHPATSSFCRWAKKNRAARHEYGGGMCLYWVGEFNQSLERKDAYARAFAEVLRAAGIDASARSRMD